MTKIFIGNRQDYGIKAKCEARLAKMTNTFSDERLSRYGLSRDAETFDDFIRGGDKSLEKYQAALEAELNVNSGIPFIAQKARQELAEALGELKAYIREVTICMGGVDIGFLADDIRFDNEQGKVVLTDSGNDKLADLTGYYLTNQSQINVWNLATEIKEKYERLHGMVMGCSGKRLGINMVLNFNNDGTASINKDIVTNL